MTNEAGDNIELQPSHFYLQHLAPRFIPEGSHRILSTSPRDDLKVVAFRRNDSKFAIVVMNIADKAYDFQIGLTGNYLQAEIPARSMQTYVL
jgi:O-glycosyl hydrolase